MRVVLLEKGLHWTTRLLDLTKLEQKSSEYLEINPNGVVPTLFHGDRVIYDGANPSRFDTGAGPGV